MLLSLREKASDTLQENIQSMQAEWELKALTDRSMKPKETDLFTPADTTQITCTTSPHKANVVVLNKGFWSLMMPIKDSREHQFTINVKVGNSYRFKPKGIKQSFRHWYGSLQWQSKYDQWKQLVLADLDSARDLIDAAEPFDHLISLVCCKSSARLCERMGLRVENDFAFLFRKDGLRSAPGNGIRSLRRRGKR